MVKCANCHQDFYENIVMTALAFSVMKCVRKRIIYNRCTCTLYTCIFNLGHLILTVATAHSPTLKLLNIILIALNCLHRT